MFEMSLQVVLNATVDNFVLNVQIQEPAIANTEVLIDNVGMFYHDYDDLLTAVLEAFAADFNVIHSDGWDAKNINKTAGFIAGLIKATILTPYEVDGFLFGGFKWISDFGK